MKNIKLSDIPLHANEGTFLSHGVSKTQEIINSQFINITVCEDAGNAPVTFADECLMETVSITNSAETFYGLLCTGLTEKTKNTFTCTNSSFFGCGRQQNPVLSLSNAGCSSNPYTSCFTMQRKILDSSGTYSFTNCKWKNCKSPSDNDRGGAICCSTPEVFISITMCTFIDCCCTESSNGHSGGTIYATDLASISVTNSLFQWTKSTPQAYLGGAMYLEKINSVDITDDSFTQFSINSTGGAIFIQSCSTESQSTPVINNCRFIKGIASNGRGGGVYAANIKQYDNFLTNSLFSECSAVSAGALWLQFSSYPSSTSSEVYPVKNCFFNRNSLSRTNGYGNDVLIFGCDIKDENPLFLSCFSTSDSPRVGYYYYYSYESTDVSWLPLKPLMYVSTNGNDNHDCRSIGTACKTIAHAQEQGITFLRTILSEYSVSESTTYILAFISVY